MTDTIAEFRTNLVGDVLVQPVYTECWVRISKAEAVFMFKHMGCRIDAFNFEYFGGDTYIDARPN